MTPGDYIYIVDRRSNRKDYPTIEEQNCFIGTSVEKCIDWIKKNKGASDHEHYWWWTMHSVQVDVSTNFLSTMRHFDWDGDELTEEPLSMQLLFSHDLSKVKKGDYLYLRDGRKYKITDLEKTPSGFLIWNDARCLEKFKYKNKKNADTAKYARLVPSIELSQK